jgi:hypothetical protein
MIKVPYPLSKRVFSQESQGSEPKAQQRSKAGSLTALLFFWRKDGKDAYNEA